MGLYESARLSRTGEGTYAAATDPNYWNLIGPFGGWLAAVLLHCVLAEEETLGVPLSFSINFAGAMEPGTFAVRLRDLRRNRSTTFWSAELVQVQAGAEVLCAFATIVTARRRESAAFLELIPPAMPAVETLTRFDPPRSPEFLQRLDMRFIAARGFPKLIDGAIVTWMRALDSDVLDFETLTALCDAGLPQIFLRLKRRVPVSSVTLNVFYHATVQELAAAGSGYVANRTRMRRAAHGFFDATTEVWSPNGTLLATTEQIVWFKTSA
jgi:hypothetical protein